MRTELVILLAGAVVATFVNLVWETLDYGFPDDLAKPEDDKERKSFHLVDLRNLIKFYYFFSSFYRPQWASKSFQLSRWTPLKNVVKLQFLLPTIESTCC